MVGETCLVLTHAQWCTKMVHNSYKVCTCGFPDIYTLSTQALGVYSYLAK